MANPMKGQIDLTLGTDTYKARLSVDSIMQIEAACGCGIIKLANKMAEGDIRMSDVIYVLTPALRGGGKDIQENDIKKIVADIGLVNATKAVAELLTQSLTTDSGEEGEAEGKKKE